MPANYRGHDIAIALPCFNEEGAIAKVIADFAKAIPEAKIYVFDNNSTDRTAAIAAKAGAAIIRVANRGKGNVVRRTFAELEADIIVMADGDGTYEAPAVRKMVDRLIDERLDMVVGTRTTSEATEAYRFGHRAGNRLLTGTVSYIFGHGFTDMLSGYRVFSRRYAKSFPALSRGFEIETELTIHALELRAPFAEIPTAYSARAEGTQSKLSTWRDGARILKSILRLYVRERPRQLYMLIAIALVIVSLSLGIPIVFEFLETGLVPRFPTAFISATLMLGAFLSGLCAIILDSVVTGRSEAKRLAYLAIPGVGGKD